MIKRGEGPHVETAGRLGLLSAQRPAQLVKPQTSKPEARPMATAAAAPPASDEGRFAEGLQMPVDDGTLAHELQMSQARANNGAAELGAALSSLLQLEGPRGRSRRVPYTKHELLNGPQVKRAIRGLVDDYKAVAARERQLTERLGGLCIKVGELTEKNQSYMQLNMDLVQRDNVAMQRRVEGADLPDQIRAARAAAEHIQTALARQQEMLEQARAAQQAQDSKLQVARAAIDDIEAKISAARSGDEARAEGREAEGDARVHEEVLAAAVLERQRAEREVALLQQQEQQQAPPGSAAEAIAAVSSLAAPPPPPSSTLALLERASTEARAAEAAAAAAAQRAREELIELTNAGSARAAQIATFKTEIEALQIELAAAEQRAAAGEAACADARAIAELMEEDTANTLQALSAGCLELNSAAEEEAEEASGGGGGSTEDTGSFWRSMQRYGTLGAFEVAGTRAQLAERAQEAVDAARTQGVERAAKEAADLAARLVAPGGSILDVRRAIADADVELDRVKMEAARVAREGAAEQRADVERKTRVVVANMFEMLQETFEPSSARGGSDSSGALFEGAEVMLQVRRVMKQATLVTLEKAAESSNSVEAQVVTPSADKNADEAQGESEEDTFDEHAIGSPALQQPHATLSESNGDASSSDSAQAAPNVKMVPGMVTNSRGTRLTMVPAEMDQAALTAAAEADSADESSKERSSRSSRHRSSSKERSSRSSRHRSSSKERSGRSSRHRSSSKERGSRTSRHRSGSKDRSSRHRSGSKDRSSRSSGVRTSNSSGSSSSRKSRSSGRRGSHSSRSGQDRAAVVAGGEGGADESSETRGAADDDGTDKMDPLASVPAMDDAPL